MILSNADLSRNETSSSDEFSPSECQPAVSAQGRLSPQVHLTRSRELTLISVLGLLLRSELNQPCALVCVCVKRATPYGQTDH